MASPAPLQDHELTAAHVFKLPSAEQIVAAGYQPTDMDRIREETMDYRDRFNRDPVWRAEVVRDFRERQRQRQR